jgi:hypothetical protein
MDLPDGGSCGFERSGGQGFILPTSLCGLRELLGGAQSIEAQIPAGGDEGKPPVLNRGFASSEDSWTSSMRPENRRSSSL